jgi:hypothetical protein
MTCLKLRTVKAMKVFAKFVKFTVFTSVLAQNRNDAMYKSLALTTAFGGFFSHSRACCPVQKIHGVGFEYRVITSYIS